MSTAYQINAASGGYEPRKPIKSPAYLRFLRRLPCAACGGTRRVEAAHCGPRGLGQKRDDKDALPLCMTCHRELHELGPLAFQGKYALDFAALIAKLKHSARMASLRSAGSAA